jgi:hypothetical protein
MPGLQKIPPATGRCPSLPSNRLTRPTPLRKAASFSTTAPSNPSIAFQKPLAESWNGVDAQLASPIVSSHAIERNESLCARAVAFLEVFEIAQINGPLRVISGVSSGVSWFSESCANVRNEYADHVQCKAHGSRMNTGDFRYAAFSCGVFPIGASSIEK